MSGVKLTKAQRAALYVIEAATDAGKPVHVDYVPGNKGLMERLRNMGLIHSEPPFAYAYHRMTITDAGRAALTRSQP